MLTNLGAHCIGLVVNGVGAQSGYGSQYTYGAYRAGYSYNGYGYGYGYGTGGGKYYDEDKKGRRFEPESNQLQRIESADQTSGLKFKRLLESVSILDFPPWECATRVVLPHSADLAGNRPASTLTLTCNVTPRFANLLQSTGITPVRGYLNANQNGFANKKKTS